MGRKTNWADFLPSQLIYLITKRVLPNICHSIICAKTAVFYELFPFVHLEEPCSFGGASGKVKGLDPVVSFGDFGSFKGTLFV